MFNEIEVLCCRCIFDRDIVNIVGMFILCLFDDFTPKCEIYVSEIESAIYKHVLDGDLYVYWLI
jgi:hypothetical protein